MTYSCPRCGAPLERREYEGVFIFECSKGHGQWVPGDGLKEIVRRHEEEIPREYFEAVEHEARKVIDTRKLEPDIRCPNCGALCQKINYSYSSGIVIDHCPRGCGVWLDRGELEKVQAFCEYWDRHAREVLREKGVLEKLRAASEQSRWGDAVWRKGLLGRLLFFIYERFLG